jgi:hypothetical protein
MNRSKGVFIMDELLCVDAMNNGDPQYEFLSGSLEKWAQCMKKIHS